MLHRSTTGFQIRIQNIYVSTPKIYFSDAWYEPWALEPTFPGPVLHFNYRRARDFVLCYCVWVSGLEICTVKWISDLLLYWSIASWYPSSYSVVWNRGGESEKWILNEPRNWRNFRWSFLRNLAFKKSLILTCEWTKWPKQVSRLNRLAKENTSRDEQLCTCFRVTKFEHVNLYPFSYTCVSSYFLTLEYL